ncbi:MAG: hypothetical protein HFJ59_04105 [Clostridia bacterium]|nr:hypothetical protein [Clostridia bacterium]
MADTIKLSEMSEAEEINEDDLLMIVQNGINKKIKAKKMGKSSTVIEDTLESDSTTNALSANQGKLLNEKINNQEEVLNNINIYSTDEINTGKKWINGKPMYRKIIQFTLSNNSSVDLSSLNFEDGIIEWGRIILTSGGLKYIDILPYSSGSSTYCWMQIVHNGSKWLFATPHTADANGATVEACLLYTKTTD